MRTRLSFDNKNEIVVTQSVTEIKDAIVFNSSNSFIGLTLENESRIVVNVDKINYFFEIIN